MHLVKVDTAKMILLAFPRECCSFVSGIGSEHQGYMTELLEIIGVTRRGGCLVPFLDEGALTFEETKIGVEGGSKRNRYCQWSLLVCNCNRWYLEEKSKPYCCSIQHLYFCLKIISLSKIIIGLSFFWIYYYVVHIFLQFQYLIINLVVSGYFVTWQFISTLDHQQIFYLEICYKKSKSWKRCLSWKCQIVDINQKEKDNYQ